MLVTLAVVVFCSAIVVFFLQEFIRLFKKIFAIPGVKLLLPLALASWLIETYEDWGLWLLLRIQATFHQVINTLSTIVPFAMGAISFTRIVFLFVLASLPLWVYLLRAKQQGRRHPQPFTYWIGLTLWVIATILLTVTTTA